MGWSLFGTSDCLAKSRASCWVRANLDIICFAIALGTERLFYDSKPVLIFIFKRDEPIPTITSAIHLLVLLYTSVTDMPEFHRQVIAPTLQKFSIALLQLVEKPESPVRLKVCELLLITILRILFLFTLSTDFDTAVSIYLNSRTPNFAYCIAQSNSSNHSHTPIRGFSLDIRPLSLTSSCRRSLSPALNWRESTGSRCLAEKCGQCTHER
jgi:hypothetical protein